MNEAPMTLDDFQKRMQIITTELQQKMVELLTEGVKSKLDEELMLAIVKRAVSKLEDLGDD